MNSLKNIIVFYPNSERGGVVKNLLNLTGYFANFFNVYLITDIKNKKKFKFSEKIQFNLIKKKNIFLIIKFILLSRRPYNYIIH